MRLPQNTKPVDTSGEKEWLFQDCLKIVEAHLTDQLANTIRDNNRSNQPARVTDRPRRGRSTLGTALGGLAGWRSISGARLF